MKLSDVFIVFKGDTPTKSKRGKLYHHAKQHAASSITQLVEDEVKKLVRRNAFHDLDTYRENKKRKEEEIRKEYTIKVFELIEKQ